MQLKWYVARHEDLEGCCKAAWLYCVSFGRVARPLIGKLQGCYEDVMHGVLLDTYGGAAH